LAHQAFDYVAIYAGMADEELVKLSRDSADLVETARTALQSEMDKRGLQAPPPEPKAVLMCPVCKREVDDPLTCGECSTSICRVCGTRVRTREELE
jgi:hypothetical protein